MPRIVQQSSSRRLANPIYLVSSGDVAGTAGAVLRRPPDIGVSVSMIYVDYCVCLFLQDLVQSCLHGGGGDMGGPVLRETTVPITKLFAWGGGGNNGGAEACVD
jgi:hypothetical protein